MKLQTWKIQGRGAFHFGEHGIGHEESRVTWPSDSLFAALVIRLAALYGPEAVENWLGTPQAPRTPPFLVTSTFPYAGEVRFFPVPKAALRPPKQTQTAPALRPKDLKKVRFVSEGIYRLLIQGHSLLSVWETHRLLRIHHETVWLLPAEEGGLPISPKQRRQNCHPETLKFWSAEKRPRVAVGRALHNSNLFHIGAVHFAKGCGLWFGVQWLSDDPQQHALLQDLLTDLGDTGLGAERTSGYGAATITPWHDLDLPTPEDGAMWTTLSRYLPRADEIPALRDPAAAYEVERLGGWLDGYSLRRRAINLLREGAVLGPLDQPLPYGQLVDLKPVPGPEDTFQPPAHPVWRSGLAVAVGYQRGEA